MPHAKSGRLRALALPALRHPRWFRLCPRGVAGARYEAVGSTGTWVPAKTPAAIINRLNQEIVRVLGQPDVKEKC